MAVFTTSWLLDITSIFIVFLTSVYVYFTWTFDYWKKRGVKSIRPLPILGNFQNWAFLRTDIGGMFKQLYDQGKGNDLVGIWVFRRPALVVVSPEMVKAVLVKDFQHFADRSTHADRTHDPLGSDNLFFGKNPHWRYMRVKLTHLFSSAKMRTMFNLMNDIGVDLEECIARNGNQPTEMKETAAKFTTDVIATTAYGLRANALGDPDAAFNAFRTRLLGFRFLRSVQFMSIFFLQGLAKIWKSKVFEDDCADWMRDVFWKTVNEREKTKEVRNDLIGTLIALRDETKEDDLIKFSGDSLVAQAAIFFTAGNDSSSTTISFLLYELALQPKIQEKLANEILTTLKKYNGDVTYDALQEMSYLEMCLKETLRIYPPLGFLDRECTKTYHVPGSSLVIEKGTIIYIPVMGLQNDPQYFKDPKLFNPDRFSKEDGHDIVPFTFLPFGEGPRNCIGERFGMLQTRLAIIHVIRRFSVQRCSETQVPLQWQTLTLSPTAKGGINLLCVPRN